MKECQQNGKRDTLSSISRNATSVSAATTEELRCRISLKGVQSHLAEPNERRYIPASPTRRLPKGGKILAIIFLETESRDMPMRLLHACLFPLRLY
ncbi:hypothetical protein DPMN_029939 [Dreissena polymorpha]|uniref:Uncharacterized protein n=1 Tax=Dreissena polymorpha TaxID=45954 RepID=A0A9D4M1Q9_DREPO|nr:hypothetical protein DPMN_029939 [Dreissena polymorpha]